MTARDDLYDAIVAGDGRIGTQLKASHLIGAFRTEELAGASRREHELEQQVQSLTLKLRSAMGEWAADSEPMLRDVREAEERAKAAEAEAAELKVIRGALQDDNVELAQEAKRMERRADALAAVALTVANELTQSGNHDYADRLSGAIDQYEETPA